MRCKLHNFLINQKDAPYIPERYLDLINENGEYVSGVWRSNNPDTVLANLEFRSSVRVHEDAKRCRDNLKKFVNSARGSVEWQARADSNSLFFQTSWKTLYE